MFLLSLNSQPKFAAFAAYRGHFGVLLIEKDMGWLG
jgi:hypothetical protein